MKGFKNILLGKGILLFLVFLSCTSLAQKTMIFTDLYRDYRNGQELYDKMKYSAALDKFGQIVQEIENPKINYKIFNNLAYGQWTLNEIESGEAWENIIHYNK